MKIENENSINAMLIQKQSSSNGVLGSGFSSFLNQNDKENHEKQKSFSKEEINNQWQTLQNTAYLNKLALGIVA